MQKLTTLFLAGVLALGLGGRALAEENESGHEHQSVKIEDAPTAVQTTLKKEAKGGEIEELRKETRKDGTVIYEAEIVNSGKGRDLEVNAEGKILKRGKAHDEKGEHEKREHEAK
jgi:hypothetical protein